MSLIPEYWVNGANMTITCDVCAKDDVVMKSTYYKMLGRELTKEDLKSANPWLLYAVLAVGGSGDIDLFSFDESDWKFDEEKGHVVCLADDAVYVSECFGYKHKDSWSVVMQPCSSEENKAISSSKKQSKEWTEIYATVIKNQKQNKKSKYTLFETEHKQSKKPKTTEQTKQVEDEDNDDNEDDEENDGTYKRKMPVYLAIRFTDNDELSIWKLTQQDPKFKYSTLKKIQQLHTEEFIAKILKTEKNHVVTINDPESQWNNNQDDIFLQIEELDEILNAIAIPVTDDASFEGTVAFIEFHFL